MSVINYLMHMIHSLTIPYRRLRILSMLFCMAFSLLSVSSATVTDVLNHTDLTATSNTYTDFSGVKKTSAAIYAGNTAVQNSSIGIRSSGLSGIITTASGGKVRSITVTWTSNTAGRTLQVYGKNTAYSSAADLYGGGASQGTLIGEIVYGTNSSITISGDYEYIGLRSKTGMLSVEDLTIEWETGSGTELQEPNVAFAHASVTREYTSLQYQQQATTTTGYDGTLTYSCTNAGYFNINSSTGMVSWTEGAKGQQTVVTATAPSTANYKAGTASYTLQLTSASTGSDVYTLVTDAAQIQSDGSQYILVASYGTPAAYYAMGGQSGNVRQPVAVQLNGNEIDIDGTSATPFTMESIGNGQYALNTGGNNYLTQGSSNTNLITTSSYNDNDKAKWTVSNNNDGYYLQNVAADTRSIAYHYNNGNARFGLYNMSETYPAGYLYVKGIPSVAEVTTLAALRELEDGTTVRLTLSEANRGEVTYSHNGSTTEAYLRDQTSAVLFDNFLTNDPGWHKQKDMALIGSVIGHYMVVNGMPTFISAGTAARANDILCLDNFCDVAAKSSTVGTVLGTSLRADYIRIDGVPVAITGSGTAQHYALADGSDRLTITNDFGISSIDLTTLAEGRTYNVTGIVKTDDSGASKLVLLTMEEVTPSVILNETTDNSSSLATYDRRVVNVVVNRQLTAGMWNTLSLPFNVNAMDDIFPNTQVAAFTGYNATTHTLQFSTVDNIVAGQPYLVLPTSETEAQIIVNGVELTKDASTVTQGAYSMVALFSPVTLTAGDRTTLFLGADNKLYYPNVTNEIKAFRAYFKAASDAPLAMVAVDGISTSIDDIATDPLTGAKEIYNLSGQRVQGTLETLPKGIYIVNGIKVIVK